MKRLLSHPELAKKMLRLLPTQRMAKPEEIGLAAGFLLHPMTRYIHGIALPVDGGCHLFVRGLWPAGLDKLREG